MKEKTGDLEGFYNIYVGTTCANCIFKGTCPDTHLGKCEDGVAATLNDDDPILQAEIQEMREESAALDELYASYETPLEHYAVNTKVLGMVGDMGADQLIGMDYPDEDDEEERIWEAMFFSKNS